MDRRHLPYLLGFCIITTLVFVIANTKPELEPQSQSLVPELKLEHNVQRSDNLYRELKLEYNDDISDEDVHRELSLKDLNNE